MTAYSRPVVLALLVLTAAWAFARPIAPGQVTVQELPNGLKVISREQRAARLVAIDLWIPAGSGQESGAEIGAAHFLEHMLFKGTATRGPGELDAAFEDLGATLAAGTTRDGVHFYTTVATPFLDPALVLLADAVRNPALNAAEMERERAVILDEIARGRNNWRQQALDGLRAALYGESPYGRPITGAADAVRRITIEAVRRFHADRYTPKGAVLALVGDLSASAALEAAQKALGEWRASAPGPRPTASAPITPAQTMERSMRGDRAVVAIGAPGPTASDPVALCAADLLSAILGDADTGRLRESLRTAAGSAETGADFVPLKGPTLFAVYAAVPADRLDPARKLLNQELDRIIEQAALPEEIELARRRLLGARLYDTETFAGQARLLGSAAIMGCLPYATEYADLLKGINPVALQEYAKQWLAAECRATVLLKPSGGSQR